MKELVEYLEGTCRTITEGLSAREFEDTEDDEALESIANDNSIELCDECGWWMEIAEFSESDGHGTICLECEEENSDSD